MARLNLTIPDPLYERLERLRDRVNVSKVCATALAKELDMLEGSSIGGFDPGVVLQGANPKAERMIQRLQSLRARRDRWFQRGYEDGENWAADVAMPPDIRSVLEDWDLDEDERYGLHDVEFPESFDHRAAIKRWLNTLNDEPGAIIEPTRVDAMRETDQDAYVRGWERAVRDLWKAAEPALHWIEEEE